jgi:hypothetical protein
VSRPPDSGIAVANRRFSCLAVATLGFRVESRTAMRPTFGQINARRLASLCLSHSGNDEDGRSSGRRLASTPVLLAALAECQEMGEQERGIDDGWAAPT